MKPALKSSIPKAIRRNIRLTDVYQNIQKDLDKVETTLREFCRSPNVLIVEISSYMFQQSGKRIRPALLLLCSKIFGYKGRENILLSALVETIHTASLIHDDIIDNSDLRRGRATVHSRWGPNITVLLGDYLYILSLRKALQNESQKIIQILMDTSSEMILGELDEYNLSGNLSIGERDYLDIISKKTGSLFAACCQLGGVLGRVSEETEKDMSLLGRNIGMCFQITDDLLDYTGDEKELGKPVLSDLSEGRITLPLIYTLNNDNGRNRKRIARLLERKILEKEALQEILRIVESNGALDYTYKKAEEFSSKSKSLIDRLPESSYRDALALLPDFILTRTK